MLHIGLFVCVFVHRVVIASLRRANDVITWSHIDDTSSSCHKAVYISTNDALGTTSVTVYFKNGFIECRLFDRYHTGQTQNTLVRSCRAQTHIIKQVWNKADLAMRWMIVCCAQVRACVKPVRPFPALRSDNNLAIEC